MMVTWRSGDSQVKVKSQRIFSEIDIGWLKNCYLLWWQLSRHLEHLYHGCQKQAWDHPLSLHHPVSSIPLNGLYKLTYLIIHILINLWPGKRSIISKVKDKAAIHDVLSFYPSHWCFKKFHFFCLRQNPHRRFLWQILVHEELPSKNK